MTRPRALATCLALSLGACGPGLQAATPGGPPTTEVVAFVHATVIPMDTERALADQTVVVARGRIVAVGPSPGVKVPAGALRVDATGRYLIPALSDMHVHLLGTAWNMMLPPEGRLAAEDVPAERFLFPYVANGVTLVQELSATPEDVAVRERIRRGEVLGPRLVLAPMIDGPKKAWPPPISTWVASPEEARAAVREARRIGYDKIKAYSFLDKECYDALVATARELGLDVVGHVPMSLSVEYVLDAGQRLIAHSEEIAKHTRGDYRAERIAYFADLTARRGVWMTPTLTTTRAILEVLEDPDGVMGRPEAAYYRHPLQQGVWSFVAEKLYRPIPAEARQTLRDDFERFQLPLTRAFHARGGRLMTGSDTILPGLVPGFALHRELRELVDLGLTPYQALRASTTEPYAYLGELDEAGTIEVGKQSDLVLLDANPLADIAAASRVAGVLVRGRWLAKDEIQQRMGEIARSRP